MNYLILSQPDLDRAQNLSAAIWNLSSPLAVQQSKGRVTTHWSNPIQHPTTGAVALPLPAAAEFIDQAADIAGVAPFLNGVLNASEQSAVAGKINSAKGNRLSFSSILTSAPSLSNKIKTQEQMEADGWFPIPI